MAKRSAALFLLAVAATAHAEWTIRSSDLEPGRDGIAHRHVVLENANGNKSAVVELAIFSAKSRTLRVIDNLSGGREANLAPHAGNATPDNNVIKVHRH